MSINFLEYLACIIGLRLAIHDGEIDRGDCILILGDNTSSLGWLRKSNFGSSYLRHIGTRTGTRTGTSLPNVRQS
jgi:hypothetical protein